MFHMSLALTSGHNDGVGMHRMVVWQQQRGMILVSYIIALAIGFQEQPGL